MFGACMAISVRVVALAALVGVVVLAMWSAQNNDTPKSLHPGLVGKRVVITSDSRVASTEDNIVIHVRDGQIHTPPVLVVPKRSKYAGRKLGEVQGVLHAKFGPQYVEVHPYESRARVQESDSTIVVLADNSGVAREVRVPQHWREPEDVDERHALAELVGKKPVLLDDTAPGPTDYDPRRVQLFTRDGVLSRLPVVA